MRALLCVAALALAQPALAQTVRLPPRKTTVDEKLEALLTIVEQLSRGQNDLANRIAALEGKGPAPTPAPPVPTPPAPAGKLQVLVLYTQECLVTPGRAAMVNGPELRAALEQVAEYKFVDLANLDAAEEPWKSTASRYGDHRLVVLRNSKIVYDNDLPFSLARALEIVAKYSAAKPPAPAAKPLSKFTTGDKVEIGGWWYTVALKDGKWKAVWCDECNGMTLEQGRAWVDAQKVQVAVTNPTQPGGSPGFSTTQVTLAPFAATPVQLVKAPGWYAVPTRTVPTYTRVLGAARAGVTNCASGG